MPDIAIRMTNVNVTLEGRKILSNVSVSFAQGETTALIGPNGSGKSTLIKAILGLVKYAGKIEFYPGSSRKPRFGYIPQHMDLERENPIRVIDFLMLPIQRVPVFMGLSKSDLGRAYDALEKLGVRKLSHNRIGKLSGGEFQRVMLAKILLESPDIVLMDEPVSGIDIAGEKLFCGILDEIQNNMGFTLLLVSHDLSIVSHHANSVICVNRGIQCSGHPLEVITSDRIKALFGDDAKFIAHGDEHIKDGHRARI